MECQTKGMQTMQKNQKNNLEIPIIKKYRYFRVQLHSFFNDL